MKVKIMVCQLRLLTYLCLLHSLYFSINVLLQFAVKRMFLFLFAVTAPGVVQCGGRKTSPRISIIV